MRPPLAQNCRITGKVFEISAEEQEACEYFDLPLPALSPAERTRLMLSFRNERHFFARKCEKTGQQIYSSYPPNSALAVVDQEYWWSDEFDARIYAQDLDLRRSFMEQLLRVWVRVPRPACVVAKSSGVRAVHNAWDVKDSFLVFDAHKAERCFYSFGLYNTSECIDCHDVRDSKLCYSCIDCHLSNELRWCEHCVSCESSWFCFNCKDCKNCLFCANLEGKEYYVANRPVTPEEYETA